MINTKGKEVFIEENHGNHFDTPFTDFFKTVENTIHFFETFLDVEQLKRTRFHVVFAPGSGIAYKTWQTAQSSLVDITDKNIAEKEDRVLALAQDNQPEGLTEIYDAYTPEIVSCYEDDTSTVTTCYMPTLFCNNLKAACDTLGISLFKITDTVSCLLPIVDTSEGQLFVHSEGLVSSFNDFGAMGWILPQNYTPDMFNYFATLTEKFFPLQNASGHSQFVNIEDIYSHLRIRIMDSQIYSKEDAIISAGCVVDLKSLQKAASETDDTENEMKGSGMQGALHKLRKLFEKE